MSGLDGPGATMNYQASALDWMRALRKAMRAGHRPTQVASPLSEHQVSYHEDGFCEEFALVGLHFPEGVYPDINGTYGPLTSLRVYLHDE